MKVKEESEKAHFKLNIQKTEIMAFSHITSWQIDGETVVRVTDFIFLFFFSLFLYFLAKSLQMVTAAMK